MRRFLQATSLLCAVVGAALWFFGGMNLGTSQWSEDAQSADPAHAIGQERRQVFRPGIGFLYGTAGLAVGLWGASRLFLRGNSPTAG